MIGLPPAPSFSLLLAVFSLLAGGSLAACPACETRQQLRRISLDHIKEQILAKLGLEKAPNVTGRPLPRIPPLDHLYERMQSDQPIIEDHDDLEVSLEKVIAFAQPHPKMRHWRGKELLYFRFSEKMMESRVVRASLWLYAKSLGNQDDLQPILVNLHRVTASEPPLLLPLNSQKEARPRGSRGRWIFIDVKRAVSEWFKSPPENMGLAVQASLAGQEANTQRLLTVSTSLESSSFVPFLEVHIADTRKHRTKRTIGLNCPENSEETRCCRYPLTVDFEEFGWDWVIAPKKYEANYCSGDCPFVFLPKYPHTHIVHLANPSGTSGPCCAPRKMSSISMLYFDLSFNIIYGLLPGMVVDRCGCS